MLVAKDIYKNYGKKSVLKGVNLEVKKGEVVALLGPNGAGKTTFFYSLVGLVNANSGDFFLNEENITMLPMYLRGRMGISYLPQENSIFRGLSVKDNILSILELKYTDKKKINSELNKLLMQFGLDKLKDANAMQLSGGERRRVEIARCLASNPEFILLDEPFAGVDPVAIADIRELVKQLVNLNIGVIITDHNVRETLEIVDRAYIIFEGKVLFSGTKSQIVKNKKVRKVYLGKKF